MRKFKKIAIIMAISLFIMTLLKPVSYATEWFKNIQVIDIVPREYEGGTIFQVNFSTNYQGQEICGDFGKFYFPNDHPLAKYWYTNLLTAKITGNTIALEVAVNNPECYTNKANVMAIKLE